MDSEPLRVEPASQLQQQETAQKPRGKPFVKGDPRINRRGRPTKDQIGERRQWQEIFAEYLMDKDGKPVIDEVTGKPLTRLKARMRLATSSRNSHEFAVALERAFGKVKDESAVDNRITLTVVYDNKSNNPSANTAQEADGIHNEQGEAQDN